MAVLTLEERALRQMSERQFQDLRVIGTRKHPGLLPLAGFDLIYHTWNSQHSAKGFPDVVAIRLRDSCLTLAFLELKRWNGKPSPEQEVWLARLQMAERVVNAMCGRQLRLVVGCYRPQDADRLWNHLQ